MKATMTTAGHGSAHPALEPFGLGSLALRNRLAVAPMTRVSAPPDGVPTAQMAEYYGAYAVGGFGLIVTEGIYTDATHSQSYFGQPGLVTAGQIAGWRAVTDSAHRAGAAIVAQLMHAGAISQGNTFGFETIGPSAVAPRGKMMVDYGGTGGPWSAPREMTAHDIDQVVAGFVAAAGNARDAGFDGVEIHGANGYLLDQFLTDYTNLRTDEYGGPVQNRIRLTARVLAAVQEAVGDFPVGVRLSQTKVNDFTYRWSGGETDARVVFEALSEASYLHIASEGRNFIETARFPSGATITGLAREVSRRPVIANGGMHEPAQAADVLAGGHADVLSLGRGALANPDLPQRLSSGEAFDAFDYEMLHPLATLDCAAAWRARRETETGRFPVSASASSTS
ncbi:oxidoreductase [Nocardia speluncae]|nr:NADH:flavin oxidoreductase [Nocardia speluncae]